MEDVPTRVVRLLVGLEWVEPFSVNDIKVSCRRAAHSQGDYKLICLLIQEADFSCEVGRRGSSATLDFLPLG